MNRLPVLVAIGGWLLSMLVAGFVARHLHDVAVREFAFAADQVTTQVRERLESCHLILRGGATLLEESNRISREDWQHFFAKLDVENTLPGIQGIGFIPYLTPDTLIAHEATMRAEGFTDYRVWPAGERNAYAPVTYIEPFSGQNLQAFGRDMLAEAVRREVMERARDTGLPALSGKVKLVGEPDKGGQVGALMFMAVYRHGLPVHTVEQRRAALLGWVVSPYRMNDMLAGVLQAWATHEGRYVDLHIYDGDTPSPDRLLFDSVVTDTPSRNSPFLQQRHIDFYNHHWLLELDHIYPAPRALTIRRPGFCWWVAW